MDVEFPSVPWWSPSFCSWWLGKKSTDTCSLLCIFYLIFSFRAFLRVSFASMRWGRLELGAAQCSVALGRACGWLERGSALAVSVEMLTDVCTHLHVCARFPSIANGVYYKSCSARINFYKINGARTICLIANPSVSLGKHRALPCERGRGSLTSPSLPVPWSWPRAQQLHPRVSPAPRACTAGLSSAPLTVILQRVAQVAQAARGDREGPFVGQQLRAPSVPPQRPQERTNDGAQEPDPGPGCRGGSAHGQRAGQAQPGELSRNGPPSPRGQAPASLSEQQKYL